MAFHGGGVLRLQQLAVVPNSSRKSCSLRNGLNVRPRAVAARRQRRQENVEGDFFVDHSCIDCDTCRWMAPSTFSRKAGQSAVHKQPTSQEERVKALQALLACPTSSIRTESVPADILQVQDTFPIPVDEESLPGIYHCGYHSVKSFAGTSYLIVREAGGNVLVDSPRFTERLARRLEQMGGVRFMFLTHKDDVADHEKWQQRFQCDRILHADDVTSDTEGVEMKLQGSGPWTLGEGLELLHNPGHTEGSVSLFIKDKQVLFAGDHMGERGAGKVDILPEANWYSIQEQLRSVREVTLPLDFVWLLPGHGRRVKFDSLEHKNRVIRDIISSAGAGYLKLVEEVVV